MNVDAKTKKYAQLIEAFLFWKGEPMTTKDISKSLDISPEEIEEALIYFAHKTETEDRGIVLVRYKDRVTLGTHPEAGAMIEALTKEELSKDLGKSALETLAIILYQGPVKRSDIDYVRGVNSQFILRNLLMRGLIDRVQDEKDERTFVYTPSLELMSHLGIRDVKELPDFEQVISTLQNFEKAE